MATVVAVAACLWAWLARVPREPTALQIASEAMETVPSSAPLARKAWPPAGGIDSLVAAGRPRIFSAGSLGELPCLKRWRATELSKRGAGVELQCWRQSAPEFVLARGREAEFARSQSVTLANTTLGAFIGRTLSVPNSYGANL